MTAWVLRFLSNCRRQSKNRNLEELSTSETEKAENTLISTVQKEYFPENNNIPHIKTFVDNEGLIRFKTRITERKDDFNFLSPILPPNDCILTQRLIEYYHRKNCHAGTQMLVSILRKKIWILRARRTVRNIIQNCVKCKKYNAGPVKSESVSLPADRGCAVWEFKNLDWIKIERETEIQRIKWKFNPPTADWWERLIRVLKDILKRTLGNAVLTYEELLTVLCNCESIVNSRPLTYVSEDSDDLIPLTPAMFMMRNASLDVTDLDLSDFVRFQKRVKFRARLLKDLRGRFRKEYLGLLVQKAHKTTRALKVGEIVLIENPNKKRLYWPLGKVIELIPGRDGKVRTLKLRCSNSEIICPIQRVFPLEIQSAEMGEFNDVPMDAEALKIPSAGVDVSESAIPVNALPNMPKKYGKFTEDCIPDGVFPIGDDVFVFASTYYDSVSVHIRRFKKYGKTCYPTPEGITLDPRWIEYIMRKRKCRNHWRNYQVDFSLLNDTFK
ncbi:putative RNA-directed DNA polymerase from transposon X-element [Trichonephila clavipes]|nr:putative RNA-directed DNA polymerase from transposon X-element [Trichonephila clavipes]